MKTVFPLLAVVACMGIGNATENQSVPYKVQIRDGGAVARCGPGEKYYATEKISAGIDVEVWRQDPGGWLAIRPLEESFSLVAPDGLRYEADSDLAQVKGDKVVAWVGSNIEEVEEYKWQVRLMPGESVQILGKAELHLHSGSRKRSLARIAPPSGEFRWIHESSLDDEGPDRGDITSDEGVELAQFRVIVDENAPQKGPVRDDFVPRRTASRDTAGRRSSSVADVSRVLKSKPLLSSSEFNQQLSESQVNLSLLVAQPPDSWNLEGLMDEVSELVDRGSSTLQRARAQRLLEQIEEFEDLRSRFVSLGKSDSRPVGTGRSSEEPSTDALSSLGPGPSFDGSGWLLPVHSTKRNAPPYALLDDEGRILQFVSPAPGLNLHRFLRKEIGIFGQKSSHTTFEKPHLTAHRIVDLARHRR